MRQPARPGDSRFPSLAHGITTLCRPLTANSPTTHPPCRTLPQLQAFVDKHAAQFPTLTVERLGFRGMARLVLVSEDSGREEVLPVETWTSAALLEFLSARLKGRKGAS